MINWKKEKDNLIKYIFEDKLSYEQIGKIYRVSCQAVRKAAKKLNITLPQRRKINKKETFNKGSGEKRYCLNCGKELLGNHLCKYCSNKCQHEYQIKAKYSDYLKNQDAFTGKEITYQWLKKIILVEQEHKCEICGMLNTWNGQDLHFILDHIDGDATNNRRNNLRLVCPNCDSQLPTYKARNIGKSTRKYKPYHLK